MTSGANINNILKKDEKGTITGLWGYTQQLAAYEKSGKFWELYPFKKLAYLFKYAVCKKQDWYYNWLLFIANFEQN